MTGRQWQKTERLSKYGTTTRLAGQIRKRNRCASRPGLNEPTTMERGDVWTNRRGCVHRATHDESRELDSNVLSTEIRRRPEYCKFDIEKRRSILKSYPFRCVVVSTPCGIYMSHNKAFVQESFCAHASTWRTCVAAKPSPANHPHSSFCLSHAVREVISGCMLAPIGIGDAPAEPEPDPRSMWLIT